MRASRIIVLVLSAAVVGLLVFGSLVYRAVDVEQVSPSDALARFTAARAQFANQTPMLEINRAGAIVPSAPTPLDPGAAALKRFEVLAYRAADGRLVVAHVPFWFFRLKRPAVQFAVRGTGLDLDRLELTTDNLTRHGPGLVLDQTLPTGNRLLVWTE